MSLTPGPWHVEPMLGDIMVYAEDEGDKGRPVCKVTRVNGNYDEIYGNDNARLIAAAPELLDALEGLLNCHDAEDFDSARDVAVAAIRKARGE